MKPYDPRKIEPKIQKRWEKEHIYQASDTSQKPKFYGLIEFPYPSGDGLHVGHIRSNTAMDVIARKRRMEGFEVLYPIGWDAFGLPTENYAIKTGIQPAVVTRKNTDTFRRQLKALGFSFDWSREINTTDPEYYRWTQWIFLQFFKKGLAYKKKMAINWCPKDKIGLANEEVVDGACERCGTPVEKREKEQWMLAITKYADRLDKDLDTVDFSERIKIQQRNWIGRSEGVNLRFKVKDLDMYFEMYDSIPQTHMAQTFTVIAPEHPQLVELVKGTEFEKPVMQKAQEIIAKRLKGIYEETAEMDGIFTGRYVEYPPAKKSLPIWVASFVVADYGTGVVNCSFHDERDFKFAKKFDIPLHPVLFPKDSVHAEKVRKQEIFYREPDGILEEPVEFRGRRWDEARADIIDSLVKKGWATKAVNYKLRDWVFSRQRYWGEPIPLVHCEKCGWVAIPEKDLPVTLPKVKNYQPTDTGESPLAGIEKWVQTKCPQCKGDARRETDTMPNWAGSSWYYLRYADSKNKEEFASAEKLKKWTPVDWYNGGMEHTTLHLLYSRFWHKFLFDQGLVPTSEPYSKRTSHGLILAEGGVKMSKSKGNVINPDSLIETVGADSLRLYEMFMGPFDQAIAWSTDGAVGTRRFLERVWNLQQKVEKEQREEATELHAVLHKTIKKVSEDIEQMKFNTAVSQLMICINECEKQETVVLKTYQTLLQLLAPFAPHISEELWGVFGTDKSIHLSRWPEFDARVIKEMSRSIAVQINGKVRGIILVAADTSETEAMRLAFELPEVKKWLGTGVVRKVVYVLGKILSITI
ncbi:MAG: leucine--tRNA ligase [Candidatus Taylorbacteria bacterium RIFCSPHIGHO2_01_FULL_46_22b]|uniref:Leucine--tRNA ligase n=1 Tax=Candidatus Taylorbacteria bacterium RIFCSPHIGHO2_01_FULL_46_22b TaxID=1802301 RepID=A0A1G2M1B0_9BACT|nr:MAG: leucine--tRNA ligase [Candidatus Taylorbacteria bacterium RIFCSPHIGHO2_01_FULL_46_22b]